MKRKYIELIDMIRKILNRIRAFIISSLCYNLEIQLTHISVRLAFELKIIYGNMHS